MPSAAPRGPATVAAGWLGIWSAGRYRRFHAMSATRSSRGCPGASGLACPCGGHTAVPKRGDPEAPPACRWCDEWPALFTLNGTNVCDACLRNRWKPGGRVGISGVPDRPQS